jgi:hypothetical protein
MRFIGQTPPGSAGSRNKAGSRARIEKVRAAAEAEVQEKYAQPLMAAVAALPRQDLAAMAEALVSLTAFRARMSLTDNECVGGPIDVAILSKGDGFVWVKRKVQLRGFGSQSSLERLG